MNRNQCEDTDNPEATGAFKSKEQQRGDDCGEDDRGHKFLLSLDRHKVGIEVARSGRHKKAPGNRGIPKGANGSHAEC